MGAVEVLIHWYSSRCRQWTFAAAEVVVVGGSDMTSADITVLNEPRDSIDRYNSGEQFQKEPAERGTVRRLGPLSTLSRVLQITWACRARVQVFLKSSEKSQALIIVHPLYTQVSLGILSDKQ